MIKEKIKFTLFFVLVIFLTLGLTISFRPILAIWLDPVSNPTASCVPGDDGCNTLVDTSLIPQRKNGSLYVNNSGLASLGFVVLGSVGINTSEPDSFVQSKINAFESMEGLRIVSASEYSPLNIRNSANTEDIFRINQLGSLATGTIPLAKINNFPAQCASGEYVSGIGNSLACSEPAKNGVKNCPSGFSSVLSHDRILGCMQTGPNPIASCQNAILDCFEVYEGRLPTYEEAYIAFNRVSDFETITDKEWAGPAYYNNGEKLCNVIESGPSYELNKESYNGYLMPYRCWIPASDELVLTSPCWTTRANAGPDQVGSATCGLTTVALSANTPKIGIGMWRVLSGTGGAFTDPYNPKTNFTGTAGSTYLLRWEISDSKCVDSIDDMTVKFNQSPTVAYAGFDKKSCPAFTDNLKANSPSSGTGVWSVISGDASITDPTLPNSSITDLTIGGSAILRWTISNLCGETFDDVVMSYRPIPVCPGSVNDIDNNIYNVTLIGCECWMTKNLATTRYNDGTLIPNVIDKTTWDALTTGAYCDYDNTPTNSITYGKLYNAYAVDDNAETKIASNGGKNICPTGWHVPSYNLDWMGMSSYLGGYSVAGGKLKEIGTTHWLTPNTGATNEFGFTSLPGGARQPGTNNFNGIGKVNSLWIGNPCNCLSATILYNNSELVGTFQYSSDTEKNGRSVRCLKDW